MDLESAKKKHIQIVFKEFLFKSLAFWKPRCTKNLKIVSSHFIAHEVNICRQSGPLPPPPAKHIRTGHLRGQQEAEHKQAWLSGLLARLGAGLVPLSSEDASAAEYQRSRDATRALYAARHSSLLHHGRYMYYAQTALPSLRGSRNKRKAEQRRLKYAQSWEGGHAFGNIMQKILGEGCESASFGTPSQQSRHFDNSCQGSNRYLFQSHFA